MAIHDNLVIAETNNNAGKIMLDYDNAEKMFSSDVKDASKTYTAPKDGVALVYASLTGTDAVVGNILDVRVLYLKDVGSSTSEGKYSQHMGMVFMKKGDVLTFSECSSNAYIIANNTKFIPYIKEEIPDLSEQTGTNFKYNGQYLISGKSELTIDLTTGSYLLFTRQNGGLRLGGMVFISVTGLSASTFAEKIAGGELFESDVTFSFDESYKKLIITNAQAGKFYAFVYKVG